MTVIEGLICVEPDGSLSFGNYELAAKGKVPNFEHCGDRYKVKTFKEITKLERNDSFLYESVPGTVVSHFSMNSDEVEFIVEGYEDSQIALGLEASREYKILVDDVNTGNAKTNLGGKLILSVELDGTPKKIKVLNV